MYKQNAHWQKASKIYYYTHLHFQNGENGMEKKMTVEQISLTVRKFIFENYLFGYDENELSNDASFLEFGVLDSLGILELIKFIEGEFCIEVADEEILPENMDSVACVSQFVNMKIN